VNVRDGVSASVVIVVGDVVNNVVVVVTWTGDRVEKIDA
jgi:hypothetical protein